MRGSHFIRQYCFHRFLKTDMGILTSRGINAYITDLFCLSVLRALIANDRCYFHRILLKTLSQTDSYYGYDGHCFLSCNNSFFARSQPLTYFKYNSILK